MEKSLESRKLIVGVLLFSISVLSLFSPSSSLAEDNAVRYVTDQVFIKLRSSADKDYTTVTTVKSDDRLEIIDRQPGSYVKVRTSEGMEGWLSEQYLTSVEPKQFAIAALKSKIAELEEKLAAGSTLELQSSATSAELKEQLAALVKENETLRQINQALEVNQTDNARNQTPQSDANASGDSTQPTVPLEGSNRLAALSIQHENLIKEHARVIEENLLLRDQASQNSPDRAAARRAELASLSDENVRLRNQIKALSNKRTIYWFIAGALVFVAGLGFGGLFSRKRRRYSY